MKTMILVLAVACVATHAVAQESPEAEVQRMRRYLDGYITENHRLRAEKEEAENRARRAEALLNQTAPVYAPAPAAPPAAAVTMPYIPPLQMNIPQLQQQLRCTSRNVLGMIYTDCN